MTLHTRLTVILVIVAHLLLIPLIAMQFTDEVKWGPFDFLVAGTLLTTTGLLIELAIRKVKNIDLRIAVCLVILIALALVWIELAVGIFGTRFAGS